MKPDIRFSTAPKILAASMELTGPYADWGKGLMELKAWLYSKGIATAGEPFALCYDNPTETPAPQLKSEACFPVAIPFEPEGIVRFKEFPECHAAETRHRGRPEEHTSTYGAFLEQLLNDGYALSGPAREFYHSPSAVLGPGMGWLIQQPISKRA